MASIEHLQQLRARGHRISLHRDAFGNHWAEVHEGLLGLRRRRVDLDRDEFDDLKSAAARRKLPTLPRAQRSA